MPSHIRLKLTLLRAKHLSKAWRDYLAAPALYVAPPKGVQP